MAVTYKIKRRECTQFFTVNYKARYRFMNQLNTQAYVLEKIRQNHLKIWFHNIL